MKRFVLLVSLCLAFASVSFAEMTIYFKDGKEAKVNKIVFNGEQAELYSIDGAVRTVPVSSIDLDLSGIGSPAGTYGETRVTGSKPVVPRAVPMLDSSVRQADLKQEWENASIVAIAKNDVGSIRKGDMVHAYTPQSSGTAVKAMRERTYYWYDDDRGRYYSNDRYEPPVTPDQAYIIIYQKSDGTFGKKIMDAAGFASNFEIQKPPSSASTPPPVTVDEPRAQEPAPVVSIPVPETQEQPDTTRDNLTTKTEEQKQPHSSAVAAEKPSNLPWVLVSFIAVAVVVGAAVLLMKARKKPFVDSSKFIQYERDLREFEVEIWLRHGKTIDQMMDICLKKFYQEQPSALNIANKIWKSTPKSGVIPFLIREAGVDSGQAEILYADFASRIQGLRKLIEDVAARKGLSLKTEVKQAVPPVASATKRVPVQPAPKPQTSSEVEISIPIQVEEEVKTAGGLPGYVANVLDQLAFLSKSHS